MEHSEAIGILSNWDRLQATVRVGIHDDPGAAKDLQDIIDLIHDLQGVAQTVSPLREAFNKHLTDNDNPHDVSIDVSNIDLFTIMYDEYNTQHGMSMTLSEFINAIINIKRFVTRSDVDNNTNINGVVNLDVVNYITENHDVSLDAHSSLFRAKLPGIPLPEPPAFSIEPTISNGKNLDITCGSGVNVHDINGRVIHVPPNTLPVDYSNGMATIPIFSSKNNLLLNSRNLQDVNVIGGMSAASTSIHLLSPTDDSNFLLFQELPGSGKHGFTEVFTTSISHVKTFSVYAYPIDRGGLAFEIINNLDEILGTGYFNLNTGETLLDLPVGSLLTKAHLDILPLPNGWYRCGVSFNASGIDIKQIDVSCTLQDNPDEFGLIDYMGTTLHGMAFWQHQLNEGPSMVPPIFTDTSIASFSDIVITKEFSNTFNPSKGTVHIKYISALSEIYNTRYAAMRLGNNFSDPEVENITSIQIGTSRFAPSVLRIESFNDNDDILATIDSLPYKADDPRLLKRIEFSYTGGYHSYGFTDGSPHLFSHYDVNSGGKPVVTYDEVVSNMSDFFTMIYDGKGDRENVVFGQLVSSSEAVIQSISQFFTDIYDATTPHIIPPAILALQLPIIETVDTPVDTEGTLVSSSKDLLDEYKINPVVNTMEIGYNSNLDEFLEGYLVSFSYYSVFADEMNIEFLLDQYTPGNL